MTQHLQHHHQIDRLEADDVPAGLTDSPILDALAARRRRQHLVERLHTLGPRPTGELLLELAEAPGIGDDILQRLERYAALDRGLVKALGGDQYPEPPLHVVEAGR